jgi:WD40 repeat protein
MKKFQPKHWLAAAVTLLAFSLRLPVLADAGDRPHVHAHDGEVTRVAVVPERDFMVTAGADGKVRLWGYPDLHPERELAQLKGGVLGMDVSHDGFRVAISSSLNDVGLIWLWGDEAKTSPHIKHLKNDVVLDWTFLPDDQRLVGLMLNPVEVGPAARTWDGKSLEPDNWFVARAVPDSMDMAVDGAGEAVAVGTSGGEVMRWRLPQRVPAEYPPLHRKLTAAACTPDSKYLFLGDDVGGLYAIPEDKKEPVKLWQLDQPINGLYVDRSGEWICITVGRPSRREIYRRTAHHEPWGQPAGSPLPIRIMTVKRFVSGTGTGSLPDSGVISLPGSAGATTAFAFSPNGKHAIAGGADGSVQLWNIEGEKLRVQHEVWH